MSRVSLPPDLVSISEAAAVLGVSRQSVYAAIESGRLTEHSYEGRRCLLRSGLRRQYFNATQQRSNSPALHPKNETQDLTLMVQGLLYERPEFQAFAEDMAAFLADQLDPEHWGPQPWAAWRWATMLVATTVASERLTGSVE